MPSPEIRTLCQRTSALHHISIQSDEQKEYAV